MILVVGLGNKGDKYIKTRHNIGFMIIDYLHQFYNFSSYTEKHNSLYSKGSINGQSIILSKPQTYMNLSGNAVQELSAFYKIPPENIIVIHDDVSIEFLKVKYKTNSGHAGQNGVRDIQEKIGKSIHKIKVGIGSNPSYMDLSNYVLGNFNSNEIKSIEALAHKFSNNFDLLIKKDFNNFISTINQKEE